MNKIFKYIALLIIIFSLTFLAFWGAFFSVGLGMQSIYILDKLSPGSLWNYGASLNGIFAFKIVTDILITLIVLVYSKILNLLEKFLNKPKFINLLATIGYGVCYIIYTLFVFSLFNLMSSKFDFVMWIFSYILLIWILPLHLTMILFRKGSINLPKFKFVRK